MTNLREPAGRQRLRALRRRIVLGSIGVAALFLAFWRIWDLDMTMFWELLVGSVLFVGLLAVAAAVVAVLIRLLRQWMQR